MKKISNKLFFWFKHRLFRVLVKIRKTKQDGVKLSEVQKRMIDIVSATMYDAKSELMINPTIDNKVGEKYYIRKTNKIGEIEKFITITRNHDGYNVALIGHEIIGGVNYSYHFDVWFNDISGQNIVKRFIRVIKQRRDFMESRIRKDDERTLDLIFGIN